MARRPIVLQGNVVDGIRIWLNGADDVDDDQHIAYRRSIAIVIVRTREGSHRSNEYGKLEVY